MKKAIGIMILMGVLVLSACSPAPAAMEEEMPAAEQAAMEEVMPKEEMADDAMAEEAPMAEADAPVTDMAMEATEAGYIEIDALAAQALIESTPNLVIIDVSTAYANGHLPGAINIPLTELTGRLGEMDPAAPYLVYCHGDGPAISGSEILVENGFAPVYRLLGNYGGWVDAGLPVEK